MRRARPLLLFALLAAAPAAATTFVPMRDERLADQAALVAVVEIVGTLPATGEGAPVTDYLVMVERLLQGEVLESGLVVRVPGGVRADGLGRKIWGAPSFAAGERAILFLNPAGDGTWRILHLLLGAFHSVEVDGRRLAWRDLREVREVKGSDRRAARDFARGRDFDRFADWLADRARGRQRRADYFTRHPHREIATAREKYALMDQDGLNLRWFEFDGGGSVTFHAYEGGQPGLASGGFDEFQRALLTWVNEPTTPIRLAFGGTTSANGGLKRFDYVNTILFADPNDEIEGAFRCGSGGTLAYGGPWFDSGTTGVFNGRTYLRIQGGDIVTNDGIDCFLSSSGAGSLAAEELFAHEVGHTLGMGHSSENPDETDPVLRDALMYYRIHNDGRGGRLASDDLAGIRVLYSTGSSTGGGGTNPACPDSDITLCLLGGRFRATLTWTNQFNGASGTARAVPRSDLTGFFYFDDPQNLELMLKILDFGGQIKVFYGQVTNLRFELRVTDTATGRTKTYRNTEGECGAIDDDFSKGVAAAGEPEIVETAPKALCQSGPTTLCLLGGRFRVEADWRNQFNNTSGVASAGNLSDLTGYFTFTEPANVEILAKTLDFGGRVLFLWGSLSNLEYTIRLTNMQTGVTKSYTNPAGKFCGGLDENAF